MYRTFCLPVIFFEMACVLPAQTEQTWGNWTKCGDQGDGTYLNPIIPSDHSDIDCIKVGEDYYAISSTFQFSPGMTVMHSRDLVNWEIVGHVVSDLTLIGPELNWDRMNRYGGGIWAGTLRYHEGRFYVFFGTPNEGFFMSSAERPEGPWEPLTPLMLEAGWDDCSALWDEKGNAYFVGTHFADGYKTYLFKMSEDAKSIDRKSARLVHSGNGREANKLIKVDDWYYLVFSEHKPDKGRYVMARRSKKLQGPYEEERQLALPGREAMEPNQGGIVQGTGDDWYFMTHHGSGDWAGRIVSLLPVTWLDGWPVIGKVLPGNIGSMQWSGEVPVKGQPQYRMQCSDDFDEERLNLQCQWNHQPCTGMYSLTERPGWLRLKAFRSVENDKLMKAGNTLTQRCFRVHRNQVDIRMDLSRMADGQKAGLCHFSSNHAAAGVVREKGLLYLESRENDRVVRGEALGQQRYIWLRSTWGQDGVAHFYYSVNGDDFSRWGPPIRCRTEHSGATVSVSTVSTIKPRLVRWMSTISTMRNLGIAGESELFWNIV